MRDTPKSRQHRSTATRAVSKYYAYSAAAGLALVAPFTVVFLVARGATYTDLGVAAAVMAVVTVAGELPAGLVADRVGRRALVVAANVANAAGTTLYLFVHGLPGAVALFALFGASVACRSGAESAWLYDVLDDVGRADEYSRIAGRASALRRGVGATSVFAGALVYVRDPVLAFVVAAVGAWIAPAVALTFPKNAQYEDDATRLGVREAVGHARRFLTAPAVRAVVAVTALGGGAMYTASRFVQPTALAAIPDGGVAVAGVALPPAVLLASVYAGMDATRAALSAASARVSERFGVGAAMVGAYAATAGLMVVPVAAPAFTLPAMALFLSVPSLAGPAVRGHLNDNAERASRATVLSTRTFLNAVLRTPLLVATGALADAVSPTVAMAATGGVLLAFVASVALADRPIAGENRVGASAD